MLIAAETVRWRKKRRSTCTRTEVSRGTSFEEEKDPSVRSAVSPTTAATKGSKRRTRGSRVAC